MLQFWPLAASERLPKSDVDFKRIVLEAWAAATLERHRQIDAQRTECGVVTEARAGAGSHRTVKRVERIAYVACVHEDCEPQRLTDALAKLNARGVDRRAADRISVGKRRPDRL